MATVAASPQPTGNLRPLSLAQRPLQLRSNSSADPQSQPPSPAPSSCNITPKPSVDRQQKRYSTLSYASPNSPSPSANGSFASLVQSPMTGTIPGGLSRSSSRSGLRGPASHRASMDVSLLNAIGPLSPSSLYGSQPVTPAIGAEWTDLSGISDILAQDSLWIHRGSTDDQSVVGTDAGSAAAVGTLAETHAELLRSIAQKEAKCLELRTQLSQQESELKELKAQWTSIVRKTFPSSLAGRGSISMASAAVIREGMGRLFSNVTAPLASAFDALDPMLSSPIEPPAATADNSEAKTRRAVMVRGHTPGSSSRSSVSNSSFAASRHSISSASSSSRVERPDSISSLHFDDGRVATNSPLSRTEEDYFPTSAAELTAEADRGSKSVTPTLTGSGDSALTSGWAAAIPGMDGLNKKWEEIQRGDTFVKGSKRASIILSDVSASFISTFAPPLNEPLRPQKPRLISRPAGVPPTSFTAPNLPVMSPTPLLPNTSSSSKSLLDDNDEEARAQPLMVPSKPIPTPLSASGVSNVKRESPNSNNDDDDARNW